MKILLPALFLVLASRAWASDYPADFLWGAAFSAHQTEGKSGGGENSDWWDFEHSGSSAIAHGDTADLATDHWNRFEEDLKLAKSMGLNTLRLSLAWEKIEPSQGVFNEEAILHYRAEIARMKELGLRPMVAFHHFTNPKWFAALGGWKNPESPQLFLEYARTVTLRLQDLCDLWITFNEPGIFAVMGYLKAEVPPRLSSLEDAYEAAFQLARAHRMVAAMIHQIQPPRPTTGLRGVGLVNSFQLYEPYDPENPMDQKAADTIAELTNWSFVRGVLGDRLKYEIPAEVPGSKSFERSFPKDDLPADAPPPLDWIGVNYYSRFLMKYSPTNSLRIEWHSGDEPKGDNGWEIYPEGLEKILAQTAERFSLPLIVGENGLADSDDSRRPDFIRNHLAALDHARMDSDTHSAVDVRGYYHWSLTDNFEWQSGYQYRFGLVAIDYKNGLKRIPRPSAGVYRDEIRKRQPARPFAEPYRDGFALVQWDKNISDEKINALIDRIYTTGSKHVLLPYFGCQSSEKASDVGSCEVWPEQQTLKMAAAIRAHGMAVTFLPIVATPDWKWRGIFDPDDVDGWFESYGKWLRKLAALANEFESPEFIVGTEFSKLYRYQEHWRNLASEIREDYSGPLVLTANWDKFDYSFWDAFDAIGVSSYFPLSSSADPSQEELDQAWQKLHERLHEVSSRYERPIYITEIGYMSAKGAAKTPWWVPSPQTLDENIQMKCFQAFRKAWENDPSLVRANIWSVEDPWSTTGFEPIGKQALSELEKFFEARHLFARKSVLLGQLQSLSFDQQIRSALMFQSQP